MVVAAQCTHRCSTIWQMQLPEVTFASTRLGSGGARSESTHLGCETMNNTARNQQVGRVDARLSRVPRLPRVPVSGVLSVLRVLLVLRSLLEGSTRLRFAVERGPYRIHGACNPDLAAQALDAEPDFGSLLPCSIVLYGDSEGTVAALDPSTIVELTGNPGPEPTPTRPGRGWRGSSRQSPHVSQGSRNA